MKSYGFTPLQGPSSFAASESVASFSFVKPGGLTLVTAAIALWNTVYIDRSVQAFSSDSQSVDPELLKYLSPLGWEHINLTGDYQWNGRRPAQGRFRPLRTPNRP
jgi:hypothetical protein